MNADFNIYEPFWIMDCVIIIIYPCYLRLQSSDVMLCTDSDKFSRI